MNAAKILAAAGPDKGFRDADACVAKAILQADSRNAKQIEVLKKLLAKYPERLQEIGISLDALANVKIPEAAAVHTAPATSKKDVIRLRPVETKYGPMIAVEFPYHPKVVKIVKELKNRQFDAEGKLGGVPKTWLIPARSEDVKTAFELLQRGQSSFSVEMDLFVKDVVDKGAESYVESRSETAELVIPTKLSLRPYQLAGVKWIDEHNGRALVADEPGVGKTPEALGYAVFRPEKALPMLILCPANLKVNWLQETAKFTDFSTLLISGSTSIAAFRKLGLNVSDRPIPGHQITIVNYDLLEVQDMKSWLKTLLKGDLDERTYAHNELVKTGRQCVALVKEKMEKLKDMESLNKLSKVYSEIEALGKKARGLRDPKHIRAFVNNVPVEDFIKLGGFKTVVGDEAHYLQEFSSQRSQASQIISDSVQNAIALTGTPIKSRTKNLWSLTQFINKTVFPSFFNYGREFCGAYQKQAGSKVVWDFSGSSNLEKLEKILRSTMMIRRTKDQVLKDLPSKTRVLIPFVLENKEEKQFQKETEEPLKRLAELKKSKDEWKALMDSMSPDERKAYISKHAEAAAKAGRLSKVILENIEALKQAAVKAKIDKAIEFIINKHSQEGKIIVFAVHHFTIDKISETLREQGFKVGVIDGRVSGADRTVIKESFQNGDTDFLVCGIMAASEGLTLTASHTVVVCELLWTPAAHWQAEDRAHRFGQTLPVTIYYLLIMGSIEEKIAKMIDGKRELVNAVMGEGERTLTEDGILDSVLESVTDGK